MNTNNEIIKYNLKPDIKYAWNLYVPGIRIGAHYFQRFNKLYTYVELPESKIWVFLRTAIFLEVMNIPDSDERQFVLVHDVKTDKKKSWDPPKGQVEYKEYQTIYNKYKTTHSRLHALLKEGITREVMEESKIDIKDVKDLKEIKNLAIAGKHEDLPKKFHYQYCIFEGKIDYKVFLKAKSKLDKLRNNPLLTLNMPKDVIEKDNIALWTLKDGYGMIEEGDPKKLMEIYMTYRNIN